LNPALLAHLHEPTASTHYTQQITPDLANTAQGWILQRQHVM